MSGQSLLILLFVLWFPLFWIAIQWIFIQNRLPWVGILVTLGLQLLFWGMVLWVLRPRPEDCPTGTACEWIGVGQVMLVIYGVAVADLSMLAGLGVFALYRSRIWGPGEVVRQTGRLPALAAAAALLVLTVFIIIWSTGLLHRLSSPPSSPYPPAISR
jgi:hypothetical protein